MLVYKQLFLLVLFYDLGLLDVLACFDGLFACCLIIVVFGYGVWW